jgi:hypothetical protein
VLGVVYPAKKEKSLGRWDSYALVLTNYNMIFAQVTNQLTKHAVEEASAQAKAEGKGFFGRWADQMKTGLAFGQRYFGMQPAQILAETPGNFEIGNNTISELKLKDKLRTRNDSSIYVEEFELEVHSSTTRIDLVIQAGNDNVENLKRVYGERVKTPFGYTSHLRFHLG